MSVVVEIENPKKLRKVRTISGVKSDGKAIELALEEYIDVRKPKRSNGKKPELPQSFWDDLFAEPELPSSVIIKAIEEEREDRF